MEDDLIRLADAHAQAHGRLDALVLNAGMGSIGPFAAPTSSGSSPTATP